MDKTCLEIRDMLALGADASPNERIAIESHVSICAECARELSDTRSLLGNLSILREGEMPAGAAERIWRGVESAVPGRRRPLVLQWATRVAAMLVIGLSLGFTLRSVGWRNAETPMVAEDAEDSRPTLVPKNDRYGAGEGRDSDVPAAGTAEGPTIMVAPVPSTQHHLPLVEEILEPGVIRF